MKNQSLFARGAYDFAAIFITACEGKHTELPAITISSTSKELPPKTTTKENVETTSPVVKEPIESSNVKKPFITETTEP